MNYAALYLQSYKNIEEELYKLTNEIYITDQGFNEKNNKINPLLVYSNHISDMIVSCCVQIESLMKYLYLEVWNKLDKSIRDSYPDPSSNKVHLKYDDECFALLDKTFSLSTITITIYNPIFDLTDKNKIITPFSKSNFKKTTGWNKAYQAVKHDRYNSFKEGNIKNLIYACAAFYLLTLYTDYDKGEVFLLTKKNSVYSFGSHIFCVDIPNVSNQQIIINPKNEPVTLESSPVELKYSSSNWKRVFNSQKNVENQLRSYIITNFPEATDPKLVSKLSSSCSYLDLLTTISSTRCSSFLSIGNYNEKKDVFRKSPEWEFIRLNHYLKLGEGDLDADSIDDTIKKVENSFPTLAYAFYFTAPFFNSILNIPFNAYVHGVLPREPYAMARAKIS